MTSQTPIAMPPSHAQVQRKSPAHAALISTLVPGLGTILSGDTMRGVLLLVAWFPGWVVLGWLWVAFCAGLSAASGYDIFAVPAFFGALGYGLAIWAGGILDAYSSARNFNARNNIH